MVCGPFDGYGHVRRQPCAVGIQHFYRHEADAPVYAGNSTAVVGNGPDDAGHDCAVAIVIRVYAWCYLAGHAQEAVGLGGIESLTIIYKARTDAAVVEVFVLAV